MPVFLRWAAENPTTNTAKNCVLQGGRPMDYTHMEVSCNDCMNFLCDKCKLRFLFSIVVSFRKLEVKFFEM